MLGLGFVVTGFAEPAPGTPPVQPILQNTRLVQFQVAPTPHPDSRFWAGVQGPNVGPIEITNRILGRQEQPYHPDSRLWQHFVDTIPSEIRTILPWTTLQQQAPYHPPSFLWRQWIDTVPPITSAIVTKQELPFHPPSNFFAGVQGPNVAWGIRNVIITTQEQPFQALWPRPPLGTGVRLPGGFSHGYIIG